MATSFSASEAASFLHREFSDTHNSRRPLPPRRGALLSFRRLSKAPSSPGQLHCRSLRIVAIGNARNDQRNYSLDDLAARLVGAARSFSQKTGEMIGFAWLQTIKFLESQNLPGKIGQGLNAANRKIEELSYDACKSAEDFDRRFRVSERAQEMRNFAGQQVKNVDQRLGLVQKFRNLSSDTRRNLPRYRRQLDQFLQTPIGRLLSTLVFMWFLLSGWLFRIILFSMWVLPLAAPLLISSVARNIVIEGSCPSCKRRFIGNQNQTLVCNYCKAVVWQPRRDFSKGQADPTIIDVDIE